METSSKEIIDLLKYFAGAAKEIVRVREAHGQLTLEQRQYLQQIKVLLKNIGPDVARPKVKPFYNELLKFYNQASDRSIPGKAESAEMQKNKIPIEK